MFFDLMCYFLMQERDKLYLTKLVVQEILLVLKFKSSLPEKTIRYLMQVAISKCLHFWMALSDFSFVIANTDPKMMNSKYV